MGQVNLHRMGFRIQDVCVNLGGIHRAISIVQKVGINAQTLDNMMCGIEVPGSVMLQFLQVTGARPEYLLTGKGEMLVAPLTGGDQRV